MEKPDLTGAVPESWACVDCGINTAPGLPDRKQVAQFLATGSLRTSNSIMTQFDAFTEVYRVKPHVWHAAKMEDNGGCLCIGCLEQRLGRMLTPKDFVRREPLNRMPGTERLLSRRDG